MEHGLYCHNKSPPLLSQVDKEILAKFGPRQEKKKKNRVEPSDDSKQSLGKVQQRLKVNLVPGRSNQLVPGQVLFRNSIICDSV